MGIMSKTLTNLGLAERKFEVPESCEALVKKLAETSAGEEHKKVKENLIAEVQQEVCYWEGRWNQADVYDDTEVKRYSSRMRNELMDWAKQHIDTSKIKLEE